MRVFAAKHVYGVVYAVRSIDGPDRITGTESATQRMGQLLPEIANNDLSVTHSVPKSD